MSERFGNYEILGPLASGGMARVFRARMIGAAGFEKIVALKFMLPGFANDPANTRMFIDEARLAATLSHANIVGILDFGEKNGEYYIALEFVSGANLRVLLRRAGETLRPPNAPMAARIAAEVALGLDYAHKKTDASGNPLHIVHRDVSPQNIVVSWSGEVKILDFGIARSANRQTETMAGQIKGKYSYMAPEQARGEPLDHRCDIFTLGAVFYEMLCGERAFPNPGIEMLNRVRRCEFVPILEKKADVPLKLAEIVMRAMAPNPADRFSSAGEMVEELALWLAEARVRGERGGDAASLARWAEGLFAVSDTDIEGDTREVRSGAAAAPTTPAPASSVLDGWEQLVGEAKPDVPTAEQIKHPDLTFSFSDVDGVSDGDVDINDGTNVSHPDADPNSREIAFAKAAAEDEAPTAQRAAPANPLLLDSTEEAPKFVRSTDPFAAFGTAPAAATPPVRPADPPNTRPSAGAGSSAPRRAPTAPPPRPNFAAVAEAIGKPLTKDAPAAGAHDPFAAAPATRGNAPALAIAGGTLLALCLGTAITWHFVAGSTPLETPTPRPIATVSVTPPPTPSLTPIATPNAIVSARPIAAISPLTFDHSAKAIGILNISSTPAGAQVYLNGKSIADSPVLVPNLLAPATYVVELRKDGYATWAREVDLEDDNAVEVVARLATPEVPGKLVFSIPNGVHAFVDGKDLGNGPKRVGYDLQPGAHQVRLRGAGDVVLRQYEVFVNASHVTELEVPPAL